jgi:hypothetical protein
VKLATLVSLVAVAAALASLLGKAHALGFWPGV